MMDIEQNIWGFTPEGEAIVIYTMTNANGSMISLTNIGAAVVSIVVPDSEGKQADVALGFDTFEKYISENACMGKIAGRFANRIAEGRFTLEGQEYLLSQNNGPNHLHGGPKGFQTKLWNSRVETDRVVFSLLSPDGDENYPGELSTEVVYDWSDDNELEINIYAKSSKTTVVNMTSHIYFNLAGEDSGSVLTEELCLNADYFLNTDATQIPTGELTPVEGTPMDFRTPKSLAQDIEAVYKPLEIGAGYDHCWAVRGWKSGELTDVGYLYDPQSGRKMEIRSTQPGVQVYTGNFLQGVPKSKSGNNYRNRDGVAIECQAFPDSPNKPNFPSTTLTDNETYHQTIIYKFTIN